MAALPPLIIAAAIGAAATVGTALITKGSQPKPIAPVQQPTINQAMQRADQNDLLARRTGTRANQRVDFGAGEAFTGPRRSLLGR